MDLNEVTSQIIGGAVAVHRELGPGLLESVYHSCLLIELRERGLRVDSEVCLPLRYRGRVIDDKGLRIDLLVEDKVVVELKSVEKILPLHCKQLLTYLRLACKPLGLLVNFNETLLKNGIVRMAN